MAKAMEIWSQEIIEEAVAADAGRSFPDRIRHTELYVRRPRHHVAMLQHFAERDQTSVSAALARTCAY
ncbi:MAG TPA: hypothetical protein VF962_04930 [Gemmatimonadaceae bacterium]